MNWFGTMIRMKMLLLFLGMLLSGAAHSQTQNQPSEQTVAKRAAPIAIASSLRQVWPLLMDQYLGEIKPPASFGSSGNLARQIKQGAPFALFLSASEPLAASVAALEPQAQSQSQGVAEATSNKRTQLQLFATGKLVWVALKSSPLENWLSADRESPLPIQDINRIAIANPRFAPYGVAANEVLASYGISVGNDLQLTLGESAAQALQFSLSGASDGGIVPLSLLSNAVIESLPPLTIKAVDTHRYTPVKHIAVLTHNADAATIALMDFLLSDTAQGILSANGFDPAN